MEEGGGLHHPFLHSILMEWMKRWREKESDGVAKLLAKLFC